ncbi:MAG: hypothetical protein KI790_04320 [Cyclobacteriaceae bacterium]|nr:hypothetical protein [Cyclobacteriaceae bacterium HetDA_MAG_MS6]
MSPDKGATENIFEGQPYNLIKDPGETYNLYNQEVEKVSELKVKLKEIKRGSI